MPARSDFVVDGKKLCRRCGETKEVGEFYASHLRASGYSAYCKRCHQSASQASEKKKPRPASYFKEWRSDRIAADPSIRERESAKAINWWKNNRSRVRANQRAYNAARPEMIQAKNRLYYALRKSSGVRITSEQWNEVLVIFDQRCAYCPKPATTIDHFVALSSGGKHVIGNVVPACKSCNCSKRHRDPFEWMEAKGVDGDLVVANICETRRVNKEQDRA